MRCLNRKANINHAEELMLCIERQWSKASQKRYELFKKSVSNIKGFEDG